MSPDRKLSIVRAVACAALLGFVPSVWAHRPVRLPPGGSVAPDEAVEDFLDHHGLDVLLFEHLEDRLARLGSGRGVSQDRRRTADRLVRAYAGALAEESDPVRSASLRRRATAALDGLPSALSHALGIEFRMADFLAAERSVEGWKLALHTGTPDDGAAAALRDLGLFFGTAADRAASEASALRSQLDRGLTAGDAESRFDTAAAAVSRASFLAGWSLTHAAARTGDAASAKAALPRFGRLLGASGGAATPDGVRPASLRHEHVARAAGGAAVASAYCGDGAAADAWFSLLHSSESVASAAADRLPAWEAEVAVALGRWDKIVSTPCSSVHVARLCAAGAARSSLGSRGARRAAAGSSVQWLLEGGHTAHAADLLTAFGAESLGVSGRFESWSRGMAAYHAASVPGVAPHDAARLYGSASSSLSQTLSGRGFGDDALRAQTALAFGVSVFRWIELRSGAVSPSLDAADTDLLTRALAALEQSSSGAGVSSFAADLRWAGIRVALLLSLVKSDPDSITARIESLDADFPSDGRTGALWVRFSQQLSPEDSLAVLSRVSASDPARVLADRRVAGSLYASFAAAPEESRAASASSFLAFARPLLRSVPQAVDADDPGALAAGVTLARRVLDASLSSVVPSRTAASEALSLLDALPPVASSGFAEELLFRRAQLALLDGDVPAVRRVYASLSSAESSGAPHAGPFLEALSRSLHHIAVSSFRHGDVAAASDVLLYGRRTLSSLLQGGASPGSSEVLTVRLTLTEAAASLWSQRADIAARDEAIAMGDSLLVHAPTDPTALRLVGELSEASGDTARATVCWQRLSAGLQAGSVAWGEARFRYLRLLGLSAPCRALRALQQQGSLHPGLSPEPWGSALRSLMAKLQAQPAAEVSPDGP